MERCHSSLGLICTDTPGCHWVKGDCNEIYDFSYDQPLEMEKDEK